MTTPTHSNSTQDSQAAYPPAPWHLGSSMLTSVFLVPDERLPESFALLRPVGWRPARIAGRVVVVVGSVSYSRGGVLAYDEVLVASPVRKGLSIAASIPQIWVDSVASRDGARALWGIPKELADFRRTSGPKAVTAGMSVAGAAVVRVSAKIGLPLAPRRLKLPDFTLAQRFEGREFLSRHYAVAGLRLAKAEWDFAADGPLGYLRGLRPVVSAATAQTAIVFGFETAVRPADSKTSLP